MVTNNKKEALHRASRRYYQNHIRQFKIDLNMNTDADIIAHLDKQNNKAGYVKSLIRKDMK